MRGYLITAVSAALALLVGQAQAHHSGAMFDPARELKITGIIQEFVWTNPHSSFKVQVLNSSGMAETWAVEMSSPNNLVREGWKRTTLKVGDKVTVTIHPLRDGIPGGQYLSIILADGTQLGGEQKPEMPAGSGN
jgi:Family of unknown function (DUF6152)